MDNDILINQARQLYAALLVIEVSPSSASNSRLERLDRLTICAYCRYQRRLNRCALCYQYRTHDCIREPGRKHIPCPPRKPSQSAVLT
ncbi:MAG: hypothetical protein PHY16_17285 [Methylobacter sp.]|nr:hypothetical protein [Methylobacter sp.]